MHTVGFFIFNVAIANYLQLKLTPFGRSVAFVLANFRGFIGKPRQSHEGWRGFVFMQIRYDL